MQKGLGGDAAAIQAGPSELVLLDEGDRLAELDRPQGTGISAAAATENDDVVGAAAIRHRTLLQC
jgi:hypothetical protein